MRKPPAILLATLCLAGVLLAIPGCKSSEVKEAAAPVSEPGKPGEWKPGTVTVIYNNDNFGYLEPCGCRVDPIGGMYRRWHATQAIPEAHRLSVDAGNLFFVNLEPPQAVQNVWREQANGVVDAYNALGWDALQPGEFDFALGLNALRALEKRAKFKFISANIFDKTSGKLVFAPNYILERGGVKVGIFGIFHPRFLLPAGLEARDPVATAKAQVKELRAAGAQLVVALSHQGLEADEALAKEVEGIDLLVGAGTQSFLQSPNMEGKTAIVQLSAKGQVFGEATYKLAGSGVELASSAVTDLDTRFDMPVGDGINPMKPIIARLGLLIAEMNRSASSEVWREHDSKIPMYGTQVACASCHGDQAKFQSGHPHSAAFFTLTARGKENSMDCLKCHSVGMGQAGGFETARDAIRDANGKPVSYMDLLKKAKLDKLAADNSYRGDGKKAAADAEKWNQALAKAKVKHSFVNVQCENCHGPRPGHPFSNTAPEMKIVKAVSCLQCHTAEQTPAWYDKGGKPLQQVLSAAIKKVACPKQ